MAEHRPGLDVSTTERGAERDGKPQEMDRRLFMQLLAFEVTGSANPAACARTLGDFLRAQGVPFVIYEDANHPRGLGLLTYSEDPSLFVDQLRPVLSKECLSVLRNRPEFTMMGRTYSSGHEPDLEYWILRRPVETVSNPAWPWAVWYPLRRHGSFEQLEPKEQASILREHAVIGRAYGQKELAHDVRLACHGLDVNDNEFVIGLIGKELFPLSHVVQRMRRTKQTSQYIAQMGPFFVGRAISQG